MSTEYPDLAQADLTTFPCLSNGNDSFVYRIGDQVAKEYQHLSYANVAQYVALQNRAAMLLADDPYTASINLKGVPTQINIKRIVSINQLSTSKSGKPLTLSNFIEATNLEKLLWKPEMFAAYVDKQMSDSSLIAFASDLNAFFWNEYPTRAQDELHYHVCMVSRKLDRLLGVSGCYVSKYNIKLLPVPGQARIDLVITDLALYIDRVEGLFVPTSAQGD